MQQNLKIMESWNRERELSVNPSKTLIIPFTKKRKMNELKNELKNISISGSIL